MIEHNNAVHDEEILNAIYYHTTACTKMGLFETIIFVADYIEPARTMSGVETIPKLAMHDIEEAARVTTKNTTIYLMHNDDIIHPDPFPAYTMWMENHKEA